MAELTVGGVAPSTFRKYANGFEKYDDFCADAGIHAIPATAAGVAAFLSVQCTKKGNFGAVSSAIAAIGFAHRACGLAPVPDGQWCLIVEAARRKFVRAVVRVLPLSPNMVKRVAAHTLHDDVDEHQARLGLAMLLGYAAGARFSDLAAMRMEDFAISKEGMVISPSGARKNDGANKRSEHRRDLFAARTGGAACVVQRFLFFQAKYGWDTGPFLPFDYGQFLRRYRAVLTVACGLTRTDAKRFGTHSGRRGSGTQARTAGASPSAVRSFAGVSSTVWEDTYADSLIPQERREVARLLAELVETA